nr:hypothetical protein [Tanacetum cinerariifolium]
SDTLIDFRIKFSISIGEIVTHWFTLIALSALRRFDNENMLSLMNLILIITTNPSSTSDQNTFVADGDTTLDPPPNHHRHRSGGSKRHKSSGSSSFNTESGEASINLNTNVGDNDEDEVQEIRRPDGRDKARAAGRKNKGSKPTGSSTLNEDEMARLMVTEITALEKEERLAFLEIKRREVECREREIEQQDMRFYLQPYDHLTGDQRNTMDEIRAKIKAKYNLQY